MTKPATILLVEDDDDIRDAMAALLRDEGYSVVGAANGKEALSWLLENSSPCLILLDLYMPVMNGFDFRARQLEDPALASIPVVAVSAVDRERTTALGIAGHIPKPIDIDQLLAHVRRHCRDGRHSYHR